MKQKNFLKIALLLFIISFNHLKAQSIGDIAFTAINSDGDDDFAIVALADLAANSTIFFTDSNWDGISAFADSEGTLEWKTGSAIIKAGSIIIFTDVDSSGNTNYGVNIGSLTTPDAGLNISGSSGGDTFLAYTGTLRNPTTFLSGIKNGALTSGELDATGLTPGTNFLEFNPTVSPDGGFFSASRSDQFNYANYLAIIMNKTNWTRNTSDGEATLPISQEFFTISTTNWTGNTSNSWNLAANWDNGIPTSSSLAVIPEVGTAPIISTTATVANLTINESDGVTLSSGSSLNVNGTSSGNATYNRTLTYDADVTKSWHLVSSPLNGENMTNMRANNNFLTNGSSEISFASYNNSQSVPEDRWSYYGNTATDNLENGRGYSTKLATIGDISFTGTINTSDISIGLTMGGANGNNFNLLGNPYTASINSGTFLSTNTDELEQEEIYVWDEATEQYVTKISGIAYKISPAQAFFVEAKTTNNVLFSKAIQSHETDNFQKSATSEIKLNSTDGVLNRFAKIYYIDGKTTGFDNGYDGKLFSGVSQAFAIYSHLISNSEGKNYQIQSLPNSNLESMVIPIGINANLDKEIIFSAEVLNMPSGIKVFLEDRQLNTFTSLNETNTEYKVKLTEHLNGIGRFYLHTKQSVLSNSDTFLEHLSIYKVNNSVLRLVGLPQKSINIKLFNILGKQIINTTFKSNGMKDIPITNLSKGIYIVQLATESGKLNKKIIID